MTDHTANTLFEQAMSVFRRSDYQSSLGLLDQVIEREPGHKLALTTRGAAELKLNRPDAAIESFNRSIEIDPTYARAYHMRGLALESKGDSRAALDDFAKAIELNPEYGAAYHSRANLYAKLGENELATDDILWSQQGLVFREQFDVDSSQGGYFDEESLALDSIARGAAGALVTSMLEGF